MRYRPEKAKMDIPKFKSPEEEEEFWSSHSALDFLGQGEEVQINASEVKSAAQEGKKRARLKRPRQ